MAMVLTDDIMRSNLLHHHHVEHTNAAPSTLGYKDSYLCSGSPAYVDHDNKNPIQSEQDEEEEVYAALGLSQSSAFEPHYNNKSSCINATTTLPFIKPSSNSPQHLHLVKLNNDDIHTIQDKSESEVRHQQHIRLIIIIIILINISKVDSHHLENNLLIFSYSFFWPVHSYHMIEHQRLPRQPILIMEHTG